MDDAAFDALLDEYGTWDDAAAFLELTAESEDPERRAEALVALGFVRARHLDDIDGALEAWDAIDEEHAPDDASFLAAWADACVRTGRFEDAATGLVDAASVAEEPVTRGALLVRAAAVYLDELPPLGAAARREAISAAVAQGGDLAGARLQAFLGSFLADHLDGIDEARVRWEAAAVADPSLEEPIDRLVEDCIAAGDDDNADAWLLRGFEAALTPERRVALGRRLASRRLAADAPDEAAAVLARTRADAPHDDELADALCDALERAGDSAALAELLRTRAALHDGADAASLRLRLARILAEDLDDRDGARDELRRAREDDDRADVREALIAALVDADADTEQAELLAAHAAQADAPTPWLIRLADLRYDALGDVDGAAQAMRSALDATPDDDDARWRLATWLRDASRWSDLAEQLEHLARPGGEHRAASLVELAHLRDAHLDDRPGAIASLDDVLADNPDHEDALEALAAIHEDRGDVASALPLRERLASLRDAPDADALVRVARLSAQAGDARATDAYRTAVDAAPHQAALHRELAALLAQDDRTDEAVAALEHGADTVPDLSERASLLVFAGELQLDVLNVPDAALVTLERAWEFDPDNARAAAMLADLYLERELWERIPPLVPVLLADPRYDSDGPAAAPLHALEGLCLAELGRHADAADAYHRATLADPDDASAQLAWADALLRAERIAEAAAAFDPASLSELSDHPGDVCIDAARALRDAGDLDRAASWYGHALEHDPSSATALRELAELDAHRAGDDPIAQLRALQHQLAASTDALQRFALLDRIGESSALLGDVDGALASWREAATLGQDARGPLRRALAVTLEAERWNDAADLLDALAALEDDQRRRARLRMTLGALNRDHLDDPAGAVLHFEAALDDDPNLRDALDAATELLRERNDWDGLQRTLRRDLERVAHDTSSEGRRRRFELCRELGVVLADRLQRPDDAWAAFKLAARIDPDDAEILERLTRTYPSEGKTDADVVDEHLALLRVRPDRIDSYHLLFSALRRSRRLDFAWRVAGILRTFEQAEPAELAFYQEHRPARVPTATGVIPAERWPQLAHHEVDFLLSRVFAALAPIVGPAYEVTPKQLGIHPRRDRIDIDADEPIASLVSYTASVLGVARPALVRHESARGLSNARLWPPTLTVGADILGAPPNRALAFRVARAVALMRPEYQLASGWRSAAPLRTFIYGAIAAFTGRVIDEASADAINACARTIRTADDEQQRVLWGAVQALTQASTTLDVSRWLRGVEFTANRAGLLICGDLERAIEAMAAVREPLGGASTRERLADLVSWSLRRDCEDLRADLGLGIGQQST